MEKPNHKKLTLAKIVSTAQGALESSWGGSHLSANYNNWHGIKCQACGGTFVAGKCTPKNSVAFNDDCSFDKFYVYQTVRESIAAHYVLVFDTNSPKGKKYKEGLAEAMKQPSLKSFEKDGKITDDEFWKSDVGVMCMTLRKVGYATDKDYHKTLKKLILKRKMY